MPKKLTSALHVRSLELSVNLGWRKQERKLEQGVLVDMHIRFAKPPKGCQTDDLHDTVCYAKVIDDIRAQLADKQFRLIELLAATLYSIVKTHLPEDAKLQIHLFKFPKVDGLTGGVCFSYGDE